VTAPEPTGGFSYSVSEEQILEWLDVPVSAKLRWVEELSRLAAALRSDEARVIAELFRRGEI
jgi:hypothetical protein